MTKDNLIQFVQNVLPMSPARAELLVEKFKTGKVARNGYLLKAGAICTASHFIEEGLLRSYTYDVEGNDVTTAFYSKKMFAADLLSFFKREPSKEYIQAISDCQTWYLSYEDMQANFHEMPEFREFGRLNIVASYGTLKHRMLSMLQETAEERYAGLLAADPGIIQNVPLKYIASYLGITDTSLSRIRKDFAKK